MEHPSYDLSCHRVTADEKQNNPDNHVEACAIHAIAENQVAMYCSCVCGVVNVTTNPSTGTGVAVLERRASCPIELQDCCFFSCHFV